VKALVTGGEGGIGRAIRARLESEGYEVESLDLASGFDVSDPAAWERVGAVELACLNAGVLTGEGDPRRISDEQYRRAVAVNVDGVFFGIRRLARVMEGGTIVATASLAGLTAMPTDVIYSLTKHAVVGFVRSCAPQLAARGIRINALCPGFTDKPIVPDEHRAAIDVPLMEPSFVAAAAMQALNDPETGGAWVVQPNRVLQFRFPNLPGPR
jgi:NAD(P)-dependent dehydrogenase (short-subunit alcohol dehydrogenase family)